LTEALGPLSKEKEQLLSDYNDMKIRRNQEYEELAEKKRNYQQEVEALLKASYKINEYVLLAKVNSLLSCAPDILTAALPGIMI